MEFSYLPLFVIDNLKCNLESSEDETGSESNGSISSERGLSEKDDRIKRSWSLDYASKIRKKKTNVPGKSAEDPQLFHIKGLSNADKIGEKSALDAQKNVEVEEDSQYSFCQVYEIVWAKLPGFKWWPAITIKSSDCRRPSAKQGNTWVFWFGDYKISEISMHKMFNFVLFFNEMAKFSSSEVHRKAVLDALKIIAKRAEMTYASDDDLLSWARNGFQNLSSELTILSSLPALVLNHLKPLFEDSDGESSDQSGEPESSCDEHYHEASSISYEQLKSGELNFENICLSCHQPKDEDVLEQHPVFRGKICNTCIIDVKETALVRGHDDKNYCCIVCGRQGLLVLCENSDCPMTYCKRCLIAFLSAKAHSELMEDQNWFCFVCSQNISQDCFLQAHDNWKKRLLNLYLREPVHDLPKKSPISVLSLFDGIGTGKVALDELGIHVDNYFASEIDQNAVNVSKFHHSGSITHLGDICDISEEDIESLGHIDLVIGGSPCNDLSLVNPLRKGLLDDKGSGCLFFMFFHILNIIKRKNKNVFFLFENVASMQEKDRLALTEFFMHEPAVIDAKYFSPQIRSRLFWGNIPGLHSVEKCWTSLPTDWVEKNHLSEYLNENLGRKAVVKRIRTVTTQINSMFQTNSSLPVTMDNEPDVLWVTELEKIFGFPVHYTDTGNLSISERRKLLGRSWSVPVIKKILQPLKMFFEGK